MTDFKRPIPNRQNELLRKNLSAPAYDLDSLSDKERIDLMQGSGNLRSSLSGAGKNRNVILSDAPEFSRNPGKVDPDILDTMFNKGGAVKKRAKKKKARTGIKVRGTKFKGIF